MNVKRFALEVCTATSIRLPQEAHWHMRGEDPSCKHGMYVRAGKSMHMPIAQLDNLQNSQSIAGFFGMTHPILRAPHILCLFCSGCKGKAHDTKNVFDAGKGKVLAYTGVPADMAKAIPAGNWLKVALDVLGGKGGGKPTNAQGQGPHIDKLPEAMSAAKAHAESILS